MITLIGWLLAGWFVWTIGEYVLHRFAMHALRGRGMASREHLNHHADRDSILEKWFLSWTGVLIVGVLLGLAVVPVFGAGWVMGYGFYESQHWRAHKWEPRTRYQRWVRRHHFYHHFGHPMENHGVTWPLWDLVFSTYRKPEIVRVPGRMAMVWLCDADGALKPAYSGDYEVVGRAELSESLAARDKVDAFANRPPVVM